MKLFELFGVNDDEDEGSPEKKLFDSVVYSPKTKFCHESPENWKAFIKKGIYDETVFCTVNQQSDFVTGEKSRIWFKVPKGVHITPDMRYESYKQVIEEHPKITGADVAVHANVPISWIYYIEEIRKDGNAIGQWSVA